jgi:long-chain acyl-CoA synthetase
MSRSSHTPHLRHRHARTCSWGESVLAVVQPADGVSAGPELAASILASLEGRLARMKWPKSIEFIGEMPRDPAGKLLKRRLRDPYWQGRTAAI